MGKQKPTIIHRDGFILEWFRRRGQLDVNVYKENPDKSKGELVEELIYPKVGTPEIWSPEAVSIAKNRLKELQKEAEDRKLKEQYQPGADLSDHEEEDHPLEDF
jgi:hypothetical protein